MLKLIRGTPRRQVFVAGLEDWLSRGLRTGLFAEHLSLKAQNSSIGPFPVRTEGGQARPPTPPIVLTLFFEWTFLATFSHSASYKISLVTNQ